MSQWDQDRGKLTLGHLLAQVLHTTPRDATGPLVTSEGEGGAERRFLLGDFPSP